MTERRQVWIVLGAVAFVVAIGLVEAVMHHDADDLFRRAELFYTNRNYADALAALTSFPSRSALAAEADMLAGKACFRQERFAEAETYFRRAAARNTESPRIRMNLALSKYVQGKYGEAEVDYAGVVKLAGTTDPDLAEKATLALQATRNRRSGSQVRPAAGGR